MVKAKFFIQQVTIQAGSTSVDGDVGSVQLTAVSRGEENKTWSHFTPSGQLTMSTLNPKAFAFFRDNIGKEVMIDISLAEDSAQ